MCKIGIMQGRVIPESLDEFQIFPISNWQAELVAISEMGVEYVELLYDKGMICKELLSCQENLDRLGINIKGTGSNPIPHSMVIDYLASVCSIQESDVFFGELTYVAEKVKNSNVKVLVVPFFDENAINTIQELEVFLRLCKEYNLDELAGLNNVLFALELILPAVRIQYALKKHDFKNIKICYDLGNARSMGHYPEDEIGLVGDSICHVHIKDRCVNGPNVMLGEGDVDFTACFNALKKNSYEGIMVLETSYSDLPAVEAAANLRFVNNLIMDSGV